MIYFIIPESEFYNQGISAKNGLQIWFFPLKKIEEILNLSSLLHTLNF